MTNSVVWSQDERFFLTLNQSSINAYFRDTSDNYSFRKEEESYQATSNVQVNEIVTKLLQPLQHFLQWDSMLAFREYEGVFLPNFRDYKLTELVDGGDNFLLCKFRKHKDVMYRLYQV